MALVSHVLGGCPGCGRRDSFGIVDVFRGDHVYQGCKACSFSKRVPLPKLKKRVIYLDQFFFSHALRGKDQRFRNATDRIARASALQLLVAPHSSVHEDETHLWAGRDELFPFIKRVSRGHKFQYAPEVNRTQLLRQFRAWRDGAPADFKRAEADALPRTVHGWDGYFRIDVGRYIGDPDLIRSIKTEIVQGIVDMFDGWRQLTTSFEEDLTAEYEVAAKGYMDFYFNYVARLVGGGPTAALDQPSASMVVESMVHELSEAGVPDREWMRMCAQFLMQSEHFRQAPRQLLSARMNATMKAMVKGGKFTNKERAQRTFNGYTHDVEHIATYAPYCDAFVMDRPWLSWCGNLASIWRVAMARGCSA